MKLQDLNGKTITFEDGVIYVEDSAGTKNSIRLDKASTREFAEALKQWAIAEHHSLQAAEMVVDRPKLKM